MIHFHKLKHIEYKYEKVVEFFSKMYVVESICFKNITNLLYFFYILILLLILASFYIITL
jgi:hypothetical protein